MSTAEKKRILIHSRRRQVRSRHRRQRELLMSALLVFFILVTCILLFRLTAMRADAEKRNVPVYKYYTTVEVSSGDTLWSIAEEYYDPGSCDICSYIDEVASINNLKSRYLTVGERLCIPYYSTELR